MRVHVCEGMCENNVYVYYQVCMHYLCSMDVNYIITYIHDVVGYIYTCNGMHGLHLQVAF